jgi:F-type H+-transporting ATPase subunit b
MATPALSLAAEGSGGSITDINVATAVVTWIAFGITFIVLTLRAWPALAATLEARELRIAEGLRKAEQAEEQARLLQEQQARILDEARRETQHLLAAARMAAEQEANALLQSAQAAMAEERRQRRQEVALERARALDELKQAAVDLTLLTAAHLLKRALDSEEDRCLAKEAVEEAGATL